MIDTHAHYDDEQFDIDREKILIDANKSGVENIITIGCDIESSKAAIELANKYDFVYAAVGVHPDEIAHLGSIEETLEEIRKMALESKKVVAIGEIGLDYFHDNSPRDIQKLWFSKQIELAKELKLPIVCHIRDAAEDSIKVFKENMPFEYSGVCHCFSGSLEVAEIYLKMGFYLGFDGPITFKNSKKSSKIISKIPLDRILIETDSPYLAPEPNRGKRNDSRNLKYIVQKIADIKEISYEEVEKVTTKNSKKLFKI